MNIIRKINGFSIIEVLIVAGVMAIVIAIAGVMSSKIYSRRSVDNVTRNISTSLQIAKLKALRQGVEYQVELAYIPNEQVLTIVTRRGNSNRGSTAYQNETLNRIKVLRGITIDPASKTYDFNPNGTLDINSANCSNNRDDENSVVIKPALGANVRKCGKVTVCGFGNIHIVEGNWNTDGGGCSPIR